MASSLRIGFVGAGRMTSALIRGMVGSGNFKAENLMAASPPRDEDTECAKEIKSLGVKLTNDNLEIVEKHDVVFLAVRPVLIRKVASELAPVMTKDKLLASVALGITIRTLESLLPGKSRVVRVMSNTPTLVRAGVSGFTTGHHCIVSALPAPLPLTTTHHPERRRGDAHADTQHCRIRCSECGRWTLEMLTAMEAMADGGVKMGIPRQLALQLAAHSLKGAAELVLQTAKHPVDLKDDIQSPMGASIYAMHCLERSGFRGTIMDAVETATRRSKETGEMIYLQEG